MISSDFPCDYKNEQDCKVARIMELYAVVLASCAGVAVFVGRECIYFPRSFVSWLILRVICYNLIICDYLL